jgi:hypothetical protein
VLLADRGPAAPPCRRSKSTGRRSLDDITSTIVEAQSTR